MKTENTTILHFHTGKGGKFHNAGFRSYRGNNTIEDVLSNRSDEKWTFINSENYHEIYQLLKERNLNNLLKFLEKCAENDNFEPFEKRTGLKLGDKYYQDINGTNIISVADAEIGVGRLNWDNEYDTDTCIWLKDCDAEDLFLVLKADNYNSEDLVIEYFDECTDLNINWELFSGSLSDLIEAYFNDCLFDITEFYQNEEEEVE